MFKLTFALVCAAGFALAGCGVTPMNDARQSTGGEDGATATAPKQGSDTKPAADTAKESEQPDATEQAKRVPELGTLIKWRRGYDAAREEARKAKKPVLVLFQEIPG